MPTDGHNAVINNKVPDLSRGDGEGCSGTDPYISAADRFTPAFPRFTFGSAARLISGKKETKEKGRKLKTKTQGKKTGLYPPAKQMKPLFQTVIISCITLLLFT